jgi:hypothetical protein
VSLTDPDTVSLFARLGTEAEVRGWVFSRQLEVHAAADQVGSLSFEGILGRWERLLVSELSAGGYRFARLVVEADRWLPGFSGVEELLEFESRLSGFFRCYPVATLCLYDVSALDGRMVMDLLRAHPKVLIDGVPQFNLGHPPNDLFDK